MKRLIIIFMIYPHFVFCQQNRWIEVIHDDIDAFGHSIIDYYDNGYLILGEFGHNYVHYNWLIKTDINGQLLWEKVIGEEISFIDLDSQDINIDGSIFVSGTATYYDNRGDPIVIKINTCGEKEWCRIFFTSDNYDYSLDVLSDDDNGCIILLNNTGPDSNYSSERITLAKLSDDGELIWYHSYLSSDTSMQAEIMFNILPTWESGYLLTGFCDYEDLNDPGRYVRKPYYIKTDSLGVFQWETIVYKELPYIGGCAWTTTINPDSTFFYSSISNYYQSPSSSSPALLKMDFEGNVIGIYDVVSGYDYGKLSYATFVNDSTIAAEAGWGNSEDDLWSRAVIIDTLGNLLNSTVLMEDLYTSILEVTYDGKLVYMSNTFQDGQFDVYLTKLNQNLEQDTFYTTPFVYDSLCPYPILSDTIIPDDCGLIVAVPEPPLTADRQPLTLSIWPNPAKEVIHLQFTDYNLQFAKENQLEIFDVFGRKILSQAIPRNQDRLRLDISSFPAGLYIAIVKSGSSVAARGKFVVAR